MEKQQKIIVCIDDERIILFALRIQLERLLTKDFTIECFTDGEEALEFIRNSVHEGQLLPLVITDEIMPNKMKGHEIIQKLDNEYPHISCLLLTGYAVANIVNELPQKDTVKIMAKPWKQSDLVETVYSLIEQKV